MQWARVPVSPDGHDEGGHVDTDTPVRASTDGSALAASPNSGGSPLSEMTALHTAAGRFTPDWVIGTLRGTTRPMATKPQRQTPRRVRSASNGPHHQRPSQQSLSRRIAPLPMLDQPTAATDTCQTLSDCCSLSWSNTVHLLAESSPLTSSSFDFLFFQRVRSEWDPVRATGAGPLCCAVRVQ